MMQRKYNEYVYLINIHVCDIWTLLYFFNYIIVNKILYVTTTHYKKSFIVIPMFCIFVGFF